jgi:glutamyl-tRNA reductase
MAESDVPALAAIGLDHRQAAVELRERLATAAGDPGFIQALRELPGASEVVVVSTCNRCVCWLAGAPDRSQAVALIADRAGLRPEAIAPLLGWHTGIDAARHLFRIGGGLESMVLGEAEIVGQIKRAYEAAHAAGSTGAVLNPLFQRALAAAKEVRTRTGIGDHRLSIASVAVDLARQVHGDLAKAGLLVVGAGEIAELTVRYLSAAGVGRITVLNRSPERASILAERCGGRTSTWDALEDELAGHDVVVSSTAAPHPVISAQAVAAAVRRRGSPLVLIDLAVPRDIDPAAAAVADAFVFNIDHLEGVIAGNRERRRDEVAAAEAVLEEALASWRRDSRPGQAETMAEVATFFRSVIAAESARLAARCPQADPAELRYGLERTGNRLLHPVLAWLRQHADDPAAAATVRDVLGMPQGQDVQVSVIRNDDRTSGRPDDRSSAPTPT